MDLGDIIEPNFWDRYKPNDLTPSEELLWRKSPMDVIKWRRWNNPGSIDDTFPVPMISPEEKRNKQIFERNPYEHMPIRPGGQMPFEDIMPFRSFDDLKKRRKPIWM